VTIPDSWAWTTLGEVTAAEIDQCGPAGSSTFTYIDIGSIDNRRKRIVEPKQLLVSEAPSRARQLLKVSDVLVSMTRPNLNAVANVPPFLSGAIGSTGFHVLRARGIEPGWIYYAVQTDSFVEDLTRVVQGALYPAVRPKGRSGFQSSPCYPPRTTPYRRRDRAAVHAAGCSGGGAAADANKPEALPRRRAQGRLRGPPRAHRGRACPRRGPQLRERRAVAGPHPRRAPRPLGG